HVFLRCCTAYRALLERLGTTGATTLQRRLAIPVIAPGGRVEWLRRAPLPAPLHLAGALAAYGHLSVRERARAPRAACPRSTSPTRASTGARSAPGSPTTGSRGPRRRRSGT